MQLPYDLRALQLPHPRRALPWMWARVRARREPLVRGPRPARGHMTTYRQSRRRLLIVRDGIAHEIEIPTRHVGRLALALHWLRLQAVRLARWQGAWWCLALGGFDAGGGGRGGGAG